MIRLTLVAVERGILSDVYRALNQSADCSFDPQHDRLARNLMLLRCLSIQDSFGYHGDQTHRTVSGKVARTTLDLRLVSLIFIFAFTPSIKSAGGQVIENDFTRPGM